MSEQPEPERDVEEMQDRSDSLEEQIEDTREDWERKKSDSSVPGAAGDPDRAEEGAETGAKYPTKRE
jgi:hypothetical protein